MTPRVLALLVLAVLSAGCGRTITAPPPCLRFQVVTVPIRDTAGDTVAVSSLLECIE